MVKRFPLSWLDRSAIALAFVFLAIGFVEVHNQNNSLHRQVNNEAQTRKENKEAFIQSRYNDCERENRLRNALKTNVEQGQKNLPIFLKLLPQFDTKEILQINKKSADYQIKQFSPINCIEYAKEVNPHSSENK